ncbi:MAG: hypothetical protein WD824_01180 [Cyclobacteriaceae bacterium]
MDEKISLKAIAAYGDAYADKVSKSFFSSKNKISGAEILSLCNVPQVNMFVIRELLLTWKDETKKIKSPYFDYDHPEVQEVLNSLMTVLSNHISVGQEYFVPLLKKAVRQTLLVIFNPYDFFSILVTGKNNKIELAQFKEEIKYLKINKAPLARLVQKLEEKGLSELSGNEAFAILDQILEEVSFTPEDLDEHIRQFSVTLPLDPSSFFPAKESQPPKANHAVKENKEKSERRLYVEETAKAKENSVFNPILNDHIAPEQRPAVYNNFQRIAKIKDSLTINQKFMFTKVLFYGDFESFSRAIDELDQLSNMEDALQYLETQSTNWDRESREFHEFMEMVEKRFG